MSSPIVFLNGRFILESEALIPVTDRGFLFADGVYEVIRFYKGKLFEPEKHVQRLARSLSELELPLDSVEKLVSVSESLISQNAFDRADGIVYAQITRGAAPRKHAFPVDAAPTFFVQTTEMLRPLQKLSDGVSLLLMEDIRWQRCDIKSISLLPNILASQKAAERNAYEAILHREGWVTEGSRSNIFAKIGGIWRTHPADHFILNGVTRMVVLEQMAKLGFSVQEYAFSVDDLLQASEVFVCSTTSEVMPVIEIAPLQKIWKPGSDTRKLQEFFHSAIG
jgi:D-alanine transaminase